MAADATGGAGGSGHVAAGKPAIGFDREPAGPHSLLHVLGRRGGALRAKSRTPFQDACTRRFSLFQPQSVSS